MSRRGKKYDLYLGKKGQDGFIKHLKNVIKKQKPEVNISEITDQYYNREILHNYPVEPASLVFRKTLKGDKNKLFNFKDDKKNDPVFTLTRPPQPRKLMTNEIGLDFGQVRAKSPPEKVFTLHHYTLQNL